MIKAIFFDIDSTSYLHAIHDSPESTKLAFRKLKEAGIKIAICTSRAYAELVHLPKHYFEMMDAIVCLAGAQIYVGGKLVVNHSLNDEIKDAIKVMDQHKLVYRWSAPDGTNCLNVKDQDIEDLFYRLYLMRPPVRPYQGEELVHVLYYNTDEQIRSEVLDHCKKNFHLVMSRASEITAPDVNKGTGIIECAALWGIKQNETAAFGDANNDLAMIKTAEVGIAMGNATELLKQHADYITDRIEDDGLCNACVHFGWIKER